MSKFNELYEEIRKSSQHQPASMGKLTTEIKIAGFEVYKNTTSRGTFYNFVEAPDDEENFKIDSSNPMIYTYNPENGNLTRGSGNLWARQEIRSTSAAFHKGKDNKMAIPNDLKLAAAEVKRHYDNYRPRS